MTPQEFADAMTEAANHHQGLGDIFAKLEQKDSAFFQYGEAAACRNWAKAAPLITAPK